MNAAQFDTFSTSTRVRGTGFPATPFAVPSKWRNFLPVATTLFDQLGGEPALRRIVDRFVDRMFDDVMIGFFFRNASRERIKEKEYEFAARHLGAGVAYTGRPLTEAHAPHPIMGGQFMRRLQLLKETLAELEAPAAVAEHWIAHTEKLRPLITRDAGGSCDAEAARRRVEELRGEGT